jgi:WD40 repeat protein
MRYLYIIWLAAVLSAPAFAADPVKDDSPSIKIVPPQAKGPVSYEKDVEPILLDKCAFCHSGSIKEGKLDMGTYEALMKGGKRGSPIKPGNADASFLYKVSAKTLQPFMPPKKEEPLKPEELALIKLWIDQGAKAPGTVREKPKALVQAPPVAVQPIRGLAVSPDKAPTIAASRGNQIHLYHAADGTHLLTLVDPALVGADKKPIAASHLSLVESLAYSPDGKILASGAYQEVVLWDVKTGAVLRRLTGFADRVVTLSFSPDGKLLATGGGAPTEDGEIKIFETQTGKLLTDVKNGHSDTVFGVSFSPDGKVLATCSADKFVKAFSVPDGKWIRSFEGHTAHVLDVGWKSDGKLLASAGADNVVKVWDYEKGEQVRTIPAHSKQITRLVFVGKKPEFLTCAGDQQVKLWNVDNGGTLRNYGGNTDYLYAVAASPDGKVVVAGGEEGVVRLYNGDNGQLIMSLLPPGVGQVVGKK